MKEPRNWNEAMEHWIQQGFEEELRKRQPYGWLPAYVISILLWLIVGLFWYWK